MSPFVIKWFLSLIIGSLWVAMSTLIAEKVSGKLGGLIAGLPTTAVVSLMFIGLTLGLNPALVTAKIVPLSSGLYCFFFVTYLIQTKKGFLNGFIKSLVVWFTFAFIASRFSSTNLLTSTLIGFTFIAATIWWVEKNIQIDDQHIPKKIKGSPLWVKASLTGLVISSVVFISKLAGPIWGGIFATFPALTISTILVTIKSGGLEFTRLIAKNILISTTTTISLFAIFSYFFYPMFGVIAGTIIAYIALLIISIPLYRLIFDRLKD